jgi:hypothetical protein
MYIHKHTHILSLYLDARGCCNVKLKWPKSFIDEAAVLMQQFMRQRPSTEMEDAAATSSTSTFSASLDDSPTMTTMTTTHHDINSTMATKEVVLHTYYQQSQEITRLEVRIQELDRQVREERSQMNMDLAVSFNKKRNEMQENLERIEDARERSVAKLVALSGLWKNPAPPTSTSTTAMSSTTTKSWPDEKAMAKMIQHKSMKRRHAECLKIENAIEMLRAKKKMKKSRRDRTAIGEDAHAQGNDNFINVMDDDDDGGDDDKDEEQDRKVNDLILAKEEERNRLFLGMAMASASVQAHFLNVK